MKRWLSGMNKARKQRIANGQPFTEGGLTALEAQYMAILRQGQAENEAAKPRWAKKDEALPLRRLEKRRDSHLLFPRRFVVPFDNKLSEREWYKNAVMIRRSG